MTYAISPIRLPSVGDIFLYASLCTVCENRPCKHSASS